MAEFTWDKLTENGLFPMEQAKLLIPMAVSILGNGSLVKFMALANFNGMMDLAIMEIICLGKGMEWANLYLIMEDIIMVNGHKENKMGKVHYLANKDK